MYTYISEGPTQDAVDTIYTGTSSIHSCCTKTQAKLAKKEERVIMYQLPAITPRLRTSFE